MQAPFDRRIRLASILVFLFVPAALLLNPTATHAGVPSGSYSTTCTGPLMVVPKGSPPSAPATTLSANCTDYFGNSQPTELNDAADCKAKFGIANINGYLRCVIHEIGSPTNPLLDVISITSDTYTQSAETLVWRIDMPNPTVNVEPYPIVKFLPGDVVSFHANGCVRTGGGGYTWKNYVNPYNPDFVNEYYGLVQVPGAPGGIGTLQRLNSFLAPFQTEWPVGDKPTYLVLGYQDEPGDYGDNGYYNHDDGDISQCAATLPNEAGGPAWIEITVKRPLKFTITDVSPDFPYGTAPGVVDAAGRIMSLAIDPVITSNGNLQSTLYAAAEVSGIWKSENGGQDWHHASIGLKTGMTQNHNSLALDDKDPTRLLYATGDDDGRPGNPFGGLWVSNDAGGTWQHAEAAKGLTCSATPSLSANQISISSVVFSGGLPFVATRCGIFSTTSKNLATAAWSPLPQTTFSGQGAILAAAPGQVGLFACSGASVQRSVTAGQSWENPFALPQLCFGLSAVPSALGGSTSTSVAVIYAPDHGTTPEVVIVDLTTRTTSTLNFAAVANNGGSGQTNVYAVRVGVPVAKELPGINYDVYAADGFNWWVYVPNPVAKTATWQQLQGGSGCSNGLHADTWAMAFPSNYNPPQGNCRAFESDDGGVDANSSSAQAPNGAGCNRACGWVTAQSGIHALEANIMAGITDRAAVKKSGVGKAGPVLYVPTGDNDAWMGTGAGTTWVPLGDADGDSGQAFIDPQLPTQVLVTRNTRYNIRADPPALSGHLLGILPTPRAQVEFEDSGNGDITQVLAKPGSKPSRAYYVSVEPGPPSNPTYDVLVRNTTVNPSTLSAGAWVPLESPALPPAQRLAKNTVAKIVAAAATAQGGSFCSSSPNGVASADLIVYIMTTSGQLERGEAISRFGGLITSWTALNGGPAALGTILNFLVNPYDPHELYAADAADSAIKVSHDCGATWTTESSLTEIATQGGAFRFDCGYQGDYGLGRGPYGAAGSTPAGYATGFFTHGCALAGMAFDAAQPDVRVAVLYPGGIAYSDDGGKHWTPLDVTHAKATSGTDLIELPLSALYDGETNKHITTIYLTLHGGSVRAISGPFPYLKGTPVFK